MEWKTNCLEAKSVKITLSLVVYFAAVTFNWSLFCVARYVSTNLMQISIEMHTTTATTTTKSQQIIMYIQNWICRMFVEFIPWDLFAQPQIEWRDFVQQTTCISVTSHNTEYNENCKWFWKSFLAKMTWTKKCMFTLIRQPFFSFCVHLITRSARQITLISA